MTEFEAEWARCGPWIDAALERAGGTHDLADVKAQVGAEDAQFWPGRQSAIVTELLIYPKARVLHLWLAGGDLTELTDELLPRIEAWALEDERCDRATLMGRAGWERTLASKGYAPAARLLTKELI